MKDSFRTGIGFDAHPFASDKDLVLGGVKITHDRGLAGHSDADVLYHAIGDAILGAIGRGDLGRYFPDSDVRYKNISSGIILSSIVGMMESDGYMPVNVDTVIVAQEPKLQPFMTEMKNNVGRLLRISPDAVGIKATTTEFMGFTGRGEGIAAMAVILLSGKAGKR